MKSICIFLAEGFEEMEAMFPLDIMRRGGLNVKTVSVTGEKLLSALIRFLSLQIYCSRT